MFGDERASGKEINLFLMRLQGQGSAVSETTKLETHVRMCSHSTSDFCKPYHYWISSPTSNFSTIGQSVLEIQRWGVHVRTCRGTQLMNYVTAYAVVTGGVSLHVRTCALRFCISGTARTDQVIRDWPSDHKHTAQWASCRSKPGSTKPGATEVKSCPYWGY